MRLFSAREVREDKPHSNRTVCCPAFGLAESRLQHPRDNEQNGGRHRRQYCLFLGGRGIIDYLRSIYFAYRVMVGLHASARLCRNAWEGRYRRVLRGDPCFVNIVCVNLASIITFRLQIEPRTWWEANKVGKAVRVTILGWLVILGLLVLRFI